MCSRCPIAPNPKPSFLLLTLFRIFMHLQSLEFTGSKFWLVVLQGLGCWGLGFKVLGFGFSSSGFRV